MNEEKYKKADRQQIVQAFRKAETYINGQKIIKTKEEEYLHFMRFYEIFAENMPELKLTNKQIDSLARDLVFNEEKYIFYEEVEPVLAKLNERYRLAIVSDAWPSLLNVYKKNKLEEYFECFVISSMIGVAKPDKLMYLSALEQLQIKPEEAVFVDDNVKNCRGAMKLGIHSILLCRENWWYLWNKVNSIGKGYKVTLNLKQLEKILKCM